MNESMKGLTVGVFSEILSVHYQNVQWASTRRISKPVSGYLTSNNPKDTKITCRAPEGMSMCEYRAWRIKQGLSW